MCQELLVRIVSMYGMEETLPSGPGAALFYLGCSDTMLEKMLMEIKMQSLP